MGSEDETPRLRLPRGAGMDSSQRRRAPAAIIEDEGTSPYDLLDRDPSAEARDLARRIRRDSDAPVTVEQVAEILIHLDKRFRRTDESAQRKAIDQVRELVAHPPHEAVTKLQSAVVQLEKDVEPVRSIRRLVAGSLAGIIIAVGALLIERTRTEERTQARLEQVERVVEEIRQDLRAQARRMNKGTEP